MAAAVFASSASFPATRRRTAAAFAALLLSVLVAVFLIGDFRGFIYPPGAHRMASLSEAIESTIRSQGAAAGLAQYRTLQQQGFPGYRESEAATNALGYRLLGQGKTAEAVQILEANAQAHPTSPNAYDSLGEAYLAAGRNADAIASYRRALTIDPEFKNAAVALQKLTGLPRKPWPPSVLVHIAAGICAMVFGLAAMIGRKGGRIHRLSGDGFVISIMAMAGLGGGIAMLKSQPMNVLAAAFTFYLAVTGWWTARQGQHRTGPWHWISGGVAWAICVALLSYGIATIADQGNPAPYFFFGAFALIAAMGDVKILLAGARSGTQRLVRHLWRMGLAMFIATSSLFLGQSQIFPARAQTPALLGIPSLVIVIFLAYWFGLFWVRRGAFRQALESTAAVS